jgi:predicted Zn finger-like uncharacterized protein
MNSYVSRCPNCETSFKVTESQLDAADGAVRCGACLQVFIASDYFVEAPIPDLFVEEDLASESADEIALTESDAESGTSSEEATFAPEYSQAEGEVPEYLATGSATSSAPTDFGGEEPSANPEPSEDLEPLADLEPSADTEPSADIEPSANQESSAYEEPFTNDEPFDQENTPEDEASPEARAELVEENPSAELIAESLHQLEGDQPDDLVGDYVAPVKRRTGLWLMGSGFALLLLAVQVFWFERDRLSTDARLRPYYLQFCNFVDCQLPDYFDPLTLMATDLVIRTHPNVDNGLVVDALLRNEAPYRQRFPSLQLRFADINGGIVAQRTFGPDTYLAGELAGLRYIPAVTEVRLSIDILDPGPDAVSYSMMTVLN